MKKDTFFVPKKKINEIKKLNGDGLFFQKEKNMDCRPSVRGMIKILRVTSYGFFMLLCCRHGSV